MNILDNVSYICEWNNEKYLFSSSWTLKRSGLAYLNSQLRPGFGPTLGLRYPSGEAQLTLSLYHAYRISMR